MSESSKVDRRRFLKYVGATAGVVGASALGIDYILGSRVSSPGQNATISSQTMSTSKLNSPPVANLSFTPKYLNPTDQQTIQFANLSTDPDNDPLTYAWYVDGNRLSEQKDYSTKLSTGDHVIRLDVSDRIAQDSVQQSVTVESDQIYQTKPLHVKFKGTNYFVGDIMPEGPKVFPTEDEMTEQLYTIHHDLGCNAIIITGGPAWEDKIIDCGKIALEEGFDRIHILPRYVNYSPDDTVTKIGEFASKVKTLREMSDKIVYSVGHEFMLETLIIRGNDFFERWDNSILGTDLNKVATVLPQMFKSIIDTCRRNYGYPIIYASHPWEAFQKLVPWEDPLFESVGVNTYIQDEIRWDENWWLDLLSGLKELGKPVQSTDWGMMSFKGADQYGGLSPDPKIANGKPYDEEPQARYTVRTLDMLNRARIEGCYWTMYNDWIAIGQGLYNPDTRGRKKGFYMYKSYQRTS